jgi:arginase
MRVRVITIPYRYDDLETGLGLGPRALLDAGLEARLSDAGVELAGVCTAKLDVADRDDQRTAVNIGKLGASVASLIAEARAEGSAALVLAGDDTAAIGVISGLQQAEGAGAAIGVVWLDAHGDFNTPETTYSGILAGMPLAILAGLAGPHWREAAGLAAPLATDRILIAGVRDLDEKEEALLRSTSARIVTARELRTTDAYAKAIAALATSCELIAVHVDLDVLDPHLVPSASTPAADGLSLAEAGSAIDAALATGKIASLAFTSLNPGGGPAVSVRSNPRSL